MKRPLRYAAMIALCGAILLAFAVVEEVLMQGIWRPYDIASYYGLAGSAVSSIEAVLGASSATPIIEFNIDGLRMPFVLILLWACAALVIAIGGRLFGDSSGYLAGLLFTLSVGGAQGNIGAGDALALALVLASVYCLLCHEKRYLASGLLAGAAACLGPLAVVLLPLSMLYIHRRRPPGNIAAYAVAWMLLPILSVVIILALLYSDYGGHLFMIAMSSGFWAFGLVPGGGHVTDALMAVANIALAACMLVSLLPLALLGFSRIRGPEARYLLAAGLLFIASLLLRQYLHYWLFALPFMVLLCASAFARRPVDA